MNKLLASLLALLGLASAAQPQSSIQTIDPKSILFTTPTLSNDIAQLEPDSRPPGSDALIFHEDEWSQVEFLPRSQLAEVQRMLTEFKPFEETHRARFGWRKVYVRRIKRVPVVSGVQPIQQLEGVLGVKAGPAPLLFASGAMAGSVRNGFSLPLGGNVTLYGFTDREGIPVLGAIVGKNPDDSRLTQAFTKLSSAKGLILVDWRAQLVLLAVSPTGQVEVWRP